jgi:NADH-quinone oxidoreductase subunit L
MTVPLIVLAALAAFGGFLYAEPLHIAPLAHFWAPVFRGASAMVVESESAHGMMVPLLVVGSLIFAAGAGAAYFVYVVRAGEPATQLVSNFPRLHRLVVDKWRIDELYELTVLGMIDAMGDTAAQFDRVVLDGVIARATGALTAILGTMLRALQTGRVQVYAAAMVTGTFAVGWFIITPHAVAAVDAEQLRSTGDVSFTAAPGYGYKYRWHLDGQQAPSEYGSEAEYRLSLRRCELKTVHLSVQNVFGQTSDESFTQCRELIPGCCRPEGIASPQAPTMPDLPDIQPGVHDAGVLDKLLPGVRPKGGTP